MLQTLKNAWNTKDIRSKIIFTLFILVLYRIGTVIPVPFVSANNFNSYFGGTILDYMNTLSGGSLGTATLFALGVSPYINASIIIQLLAVVFPRLGEIAKEDKEKMNFITRIVTVILAIVTAIGYYFLLKNSGMLANAANADDNPGAYWFYGIVIVACYVAGASIIMWLAERINERGLGNGISIILFANIISSLPSLVYNLVSLVISTYQYSEKAWLYGIVSTLFALVLLASLVALVIFVIWVTGSERRIPVQYAKRVVGRKMYGGQSSNIPLKVNMTGVMPIIFASSIVSLVPTILALCGVTSDTEGFWGTLNRILASNGVVYPVTLFILIIAFSYFYTTITFDPMEVANNLKKQGGAIPGIRQGRPTADYIRKILGKVTLVGALFLSIIAVAPVVFGPHVLQHIVEWIMNGSDLAKEIAKYTADSSTSWYATYLQSQIDSTVSSLTSMFTFGGTSLLIVVGVAIETFRELEAQLTMRNYKGFL
ncbi:MAG: preprotein translocase subunit SecY [Clostridia bacterium]|nr:preprotein translocase subunit SecY [Clostridia bacterium]